MKKMLIAGVLFFTTIGLMGCSSSSSISESDLKDFITDYKEEIYNVDLQNKIEDAVILENVKPFASDELFNRNKKNGLYSLPKYFASENEVNISLEKVEIESFEQKEDDSLIKVKYRQTLKIGKEEYEKKGEMTINSDDKENFIIDNDYETPIIVNGKKLM